MTRELVLESIWQTIQFQIPVQPSGVHMFYAEFLGGRNHYVIPLKNGEMLGTIEESLFKFILNIEHKDFVHLNDDLQKQIDKLFDLGRDIDDKETSSGKFKEIKFTVPTNSDYGGLQDGDIIEGFGMLR